MSTIKIKAQKLLASLGRIDNKLEGGKGCILQINVIDTEKVELIGLQKDKRPIKSTLKLEYGS